MKKKIIGGFVGMACIFLLLFVWADVNEMMGAADTDVITPAISDNATAYMAADNVTVPNFHTFQEIVLTNWWWIISGMIVIIIIIALSQINKEG